MVRAASPYMEWAKSRPAPEIDLATSNLLACTLDDLPGAREAVELAGVSPNGYRPLVEAIAARYGVHPENVATAVGCSGANFLALAALVGAGDDVLFEQPGYDPLAAAATMLGARVARFERRFENGWRVDPERIARALTPRTRVVMLSSPHNPSGVLAGADDLLGIGRLAERHDFTVIVDEVYLDLASSGHPAAATLSPRFVSTNSLTKAYGLASLRCGWALASPGIAEKIRRARDVVDVWSPMPSDRISVVAFRNLDRLAQRSRRIVEANSALVAAFLARRPELECVPSHATIAFPRFRDGRDAG
ncbi:MAG TPA: pyridoxal phosphate-dependent aminotransferase, partial [Thermoanaerobaculia bacterium]|nr:pyridoxal phosphate-dependent aminotransferase [Thermoanaerobaculia bacterium]